MKKPLTTTLGITAALLTLGRGPADAVTTTILQPERVTSSVDAFSDQFLPINLINQSGLSTSYTSRSTEFANYVASATHSRIDARNSWFSSSGNRTGILTFEFDNFVTISALALWNEDGEDGINEFELFRDTDNNFGNGGTTSLGTFNATERDEEGTISGETFSFDATTTRYVHVNIRSNHGHPMLSGISEIAFKDVPFEFGHLPAIIFAVSLGGIHYFRNKRGSKDK